MDYKKFGLVSIIFTSIIVIVCFVLGFIETSTPINIDNPLYFNIYDHSTAGTRVDKSSNEEKYNSLTNALKNMTSVDIFSRISQGGKLDEKPTQDVDLTIGYYSDQIKQENLCLEVVFENKQQQIVEVDGNSKVLEFFRMIFIVNKNGTQLLPIYLNHTNANDNLYSGSPMLLRVSTSNLYDACKMK